MAKYNVTLQETVRYTVTVEADDEDAAAQLAEHTWCDSEYPTTDFDGQGEGVTVLFILKTEV